MRILIRVLLSSVDQAVNGQKDHGAHRRRNVFVRHAGSPRSPARPALQRRQPRRGADGHLLVDLRVRLEDGAELRQRDFAVSAQVAAEALMSILRSNTDMID